MNVNPITRLDYPDPDVIRVEDTYYMVSTTMHFMPGCEILQSFDLVHWEHVTYVYETLDHTDAQQLKSGQNIYGQGLRQCSMHYIRYDVLYAYVLARLQYWSMMVQKDEDKLLKQSINGAANMYLIIVFILFSF